MVDSNGLVSPCGHLIFPQKVVCVCSAGFGDIYFIATSFLLYCFDWFDIFLRIFHNCCNFHIAGEKDIAM